ncbi:tetratricopeptide TPR_2 [Nitrosomonas sp. Is79A3]|uniref:hypothetical protein n=1 Tax=Nitrosomonas sp. (strain Is79A3) TaxID=261292 RepID=UPI000215C7C9
MKKLLFIIALLLCLPMLIAAPSSATAVAQVDVRAEVNAALYAASATLAATERMADEKMRMQRKEIDTLRAKIQAGEKRLNDALSTAEESYIAALAALDRTYAHEIAIFRTAVENIAATPEGAAALARFNAGDEIGALAVLDDLRAARDAARQKRIDIESAAEGRNIALLALEARSKGKMTTAQVIARYEEITRLDPGVHWDWVELGRLYRDAGRLSDRLHAAQKSAETAMDDRERSVAMSALGDIQTVQGDLTAALKSFQNSLAIAERLAQSDPGNAGWQRDLSISYSKIGGIQTAQGDLPAALKSYQASHAIFERLAQSDPGNAGWQRDLSVSFDRIGDIQTAQGDLPAALKSFQNSLAIRERLAQSDPGNAEWQRDLIVSYVKLSEVTGDKTYMTKALHVALGMQKRKILAPRDAWMIEELQKRAEQ